MALKLRVDVCMDVYNIEQIFQKLKNDIEEKYKCTVHFNDNVMYVYFINADYKMCIYMWRYIDFTEYDYKCVFKSICTQIEVAWMEFLYNER